MYFGSLWYKIVWRAACIVSVGVVSNSLLLNFLDPAHWVEQLKVDLMDFSVIAGSFCTS